MYLVGIAVAAAVAYGIYMLFIAVVPGISVSEQPIDSSSAPTPAEPVPAYREDVAFEVESTKISAWLYLPTERTGPHPCIVIGHGLGGTKATGLDAYASAFRDAGFAALAFDYRCLGDSEGEPRQLVWIPNQLEDWRGAIEYARSRDEIDPERIALWGSSLSGGHVVKTAAEDNRICAVAAQVPLLDGNAGGFTAVNRIGLGLMLRLAFVHGLRDLVRSWLRLSAHKIPLFGRSGTVAAIADDASWEIAARMTPDGFVNEVCARILIRMDKYHPIKALDEVSCPVLLQACEQDVALPQRVVDEAEEILGERGTVIRYPLDHFDIYVGEYREQAVAAQLEFFASVFSQT
jgi:fermentation-respiration switch protein FrsA (DUF1100 family)